MVPYIDFTEVIIMISKEDIRPISYVKTHAAEILNQVNETHRPVYVTQNGDAKAVLIDTESYEKMNKAINLLKIVAQGEKEIQEKKYRKQEDVFASIEKKLKTKASKNEK